ncbi:MAG: flagellar basal body-associated FliL family protein [SAR324 cluster bacterium]|nr:flagellar basal body-associated FliL family protein [SAR324 cluster bacterium]
MTLRALILLLAIVLFMSISACGFFQDEETPEGADASTAESAAPEEEKDFIQKVRDFVETAKETADSLMAEKEKESEETTIVQEGPPPLAAPQYVELGAFVVNLNDSKYFLKTTITVLLADQMAKGWLEKRMPIVKDLIIAKLARLSSKDLKNTRARQLLKNDLKIQLNSLFPNNAGWMDPNNPGKKDRRPIKKILFQEFYTQ